MAKLITTLLDLAQTTKAEIPGAPIASAQLSLFDWIVCGRAAVEEPVAQKMHQFATLEGGSQTASVFGAAKAPARMAALANGTISHAIDFDDTHFAHIGHLSVGIYPAALAVGEYTGASATEVVAAFLLGAEGAIRVGTALGSAHYNRGFHQTATAGAFGATLAAGWLLGLSRPQMQMAFGLCASRASGLKSQFGTMGKPLNAGISASNGVEAALLAQLGMTSCDDGIEGPQGFIPTHSDQPSKDIPALGQWLFPDITYKFHACCHGTHAMIEALRAVPELDVSDIAQITLRTNPRWLSVCNIANPTSGLEVKFSYAWLAALVLTGQDTSDAACYDDTVVNNPQLRDIAQRITVHGADTLTDMQVEGAIVTHSGDRFEIAHDLAERLPHSTLHDRLIAKSHALLGAPAGKLAPVLGSLNDISAADLGRFVRTGQ